MILSHDAGSTGPAYPPTIPDAERLRAILRRIIIYGSPCFMAALSASAFFLARSSSSFLIQSLFGPVVWVNAALAVFASAGATALLGGGRQKLRIVGACAYAVVSFMMYMILTLAGILAIGN